LIAFAFESAIGAELVLFAGFLLSSPRRRAPALYLLAGLTLIMAVLMMGNLLIGAAGLVWLSDVVLFFDLLAPPLVYLYVMQIRHEPPELVLTDGLHAAPAAIGIILWKAGLLSSMDLYVNVCWFGYVFLSLAYFATHYRLYVPQARQRFLMLLLAVLLVIGVLRLAIVMQAGGQSSFREGVPYLLILVGLFFATCQILLTALRHPDLLSQPGSHVKYGISAPDEGELDKLETRMAAVLDERRPYLDPDFSLSELALLLGAPPRVVSQFINARHGMNVSAYINFRRAYFAARLLSGTSKPVKAVMYESGFRSKSIFNREFQRNFGSSPTEYRSKAQG
jgi:AraC-like DNA-binding protein